MQAEVTSNSILIFTALISVAGIIIIKIIEIMNQNRNLLIKTLSEIHRYINDFWFSKLSIEKNNKLDPREIGKEVTDLDMKIAEYIMKLPANTYIFNEVSCPIKNITEQISEALSNHEYLTALEVIDKIYFLYRKSIIIRLIYHLAVIVWAIFIAIVFSVLTRVSVFLSIPILIIISYFIILLMYMTRENKQCNEVLYGKKRK